MPTYELTSPWTNQTYNVEFDQTPQETDIDEAVVYADARWKERQVAEQQPLATAGVSLVKGMGQAGAKSLGGAAKFLDTGADIVAKYTGLEKGGGFGDVADAADALVEEADRVYPTNPENRKSATIGSGIAQGANLLAGGVIGKSIGLGQAAATQVPLWLGFAAGAGEGIDKAKEIGVESPEAQLAMGTLFGGVEVATEKLGGIGNKAATDALLDSLRAPAAEVLKRAVKTITTEGVEEGLAGGAQDLLTRAFAMEDPNRPGFTTTGVELPKFDKAMLERRGLEALGGASGGTVFAGVDLAVNQTKPTVADQRPVVQVPQGSSGDTLTVQSGLEEDLGELTGEDVADLEPEAAPVPVTMQTRVPAFQDDALTAPSPAGGGNLLVDFGVAKSPQAQAIADEAEAKRQQQVAKLRSEQDRAGTLLPVIPDAPYGGRDILDYVNENPLQVPRKGQEGGRGEYDWRETYDLPLYYRKFLARADRGFNASDLASMAFNEGLLKDDSPDALMAEIKSAIESRTSYRVEFRKKEKALAQEARQVTQFEQTQAAAGDKTLLALQDVSVGDEMNIDGEKAVVKKIESDEDGYLTNVVIEDGKRFGVLSLDPMTRGGVFVDEWKPKGQKAPVDDFGLESASPEEMAQEQERAKVRATLAQRQERQLKGDAGEYGTPDLLDTTAGDMALFNQPETRLDIFSPPRNDSLYESYIPGDDSPDARADAAASARAALRNVAGRMGNQNVRFAWRDAAARGTEASRLGEQPTGQTGTLRASALSNGEIVFEADTDIYESLWRESRGNLRRHLQLLDALIQEELIHVAQLQALRADWVKAGRKGKFDVYVRQRAETMLADMKKAAKLSGPKAEAALKEAMLASYRLYFNATAPVTADQVWEAMDNGYLREKLTNGAGPMLLEFVRQVIQLKNQGVVSETAAQGVLDVLKKWVRQALQVLKTAYSAATDGQWGQGLQEFVKQTEALLKGDVKADPYQAAEGADGGLSLNAAMGPGMGRETRSRFARPEAEERMYETRADELVWEQAAAWLDSVSLTDAVTALENDALPEGMTADVAQQAAGQLMTRALEQMKNGTELQRMEARSVSHRASKVWQGRLSQEAGRALRQRAVVNHELVPHAPVLAAEGLLIDRADAVMDKRFEGGGVGAAGKVQAVAETAAEDASERIERILAALLGPDLAPKQTIREAMQTLMGGQSQREQMIAEVAQALMMKARGRVLAPATQTALAALTASLKRTLGASVQGDAKKAAATPLGEVLARAFVDQAAEGATFAEAWAAGRQRVFDMFMDMELDKVFHPARLRRSEALARLQTLNAGNDAQRASSAAERAELVQQIEELTAEMEQAQERAVAMTADFWTQVDALMPATPALAYAPGMAKEAVLRGFEKAGYTGSLATQMDKGGTRKLNMKDALLDRPRAIAAVLRVWDAEAQQSGLSPEAWMEGRKLAVQALNETLDTWQGQMDQQQQKRQEAEQARLLAKDSPALQKLLNELRAKVAPGMRWTDVFTDLPSAQKERQREMYRRLLQHESLRNLTPEQRLKLTNELDRAWQRERRKVFNQELKRVGVLGEKKASDREKVQKALPKLLRMINLGMFNSELFREAVAPEYGLKALTTEQSLKLREMAERAYKQPQGVLRNRLLTDLLWEIRKSTGGSWTDIMNGYWTAAVLSGLRTQFDTFMSVSNGILTNVMQSSSILFRRGDKQAAWEVQSQWWRGFFEAVREAGLVIGKGDYSYLKRFGADLQKALEGERSSGPLPIGEHLWKNGNVFEKWGMAPVMLFTGRLMAAADHINNTATSQGAIATARALNPELYERKTAYTDAEQRTAREQALREVTGGAAPSTMEERATVTARTREILASGLREEDLTAANTVGDMAAYQNDPTGAFGVVYSAIKAALGTVERKTTEYADDVQANRYTRALVAAFGGAVYALTGTRFMRFGFNFGADMTRYVPGTILLGKIGFYGRSVSQMERDLLLGKNVVGLLVTATLAAFFLGQDDDDEGWHLEGDWSDLTPQQQQQRMSAGVQKMTMWRIEGGRLKSVSYKQWPTMGLFSVVGNMVNERRLQPKKWEDRGVAGHLLRAGLNGMFQVQNVSAMRNLAEVFGTPQAGGDAVNSWAERFVKMGTNYAGGFVPTVIKDVDLWNDPRSFKPEGALEQVMRSMPLMRTRVNDGFPQLNLLGEEVKLERAPWSRSYTSVASGEAHRVLGKLAAAGLQLPIPDTSKLVVKNGQRVQIKDLGAQAEYRYQKAVGTAYREWLSTEGQQLLNLPKEQAQKVIERRATAIKNRAVGSVLK